MLVARAGTKKTSYKIYYFFCFFLISGGFLPLRMAPYSNRIKLKCYYKTLSITIQLQLPVPLTCFNFIDLMHLILRTS